VDAARWKAGGVHTIRGLEAGDWEEWRPLWDGYLEFYRADLSAETTKATFDHLCGQVDGMFALLAVSESGHGVGLAHCIVHPSTWSRRPSCYLEDLFVSRDARGSDIARKLIEAVSTEASARGAAHVYWHTQQFNGAARSLYDQVARLTSFVVYER